MAKKLRRILENPFLNLIVGIFLLISGLSEAGDTLWDDIVHLNLKVHHGIIIFAILNVMKTIPEFFDSLDHFQQDVSNK